MLWLIVLGFVLAGCVGYATGSLCTLLYGTATAVKMARLRLKEDAAVGDDESRLDAPTAEWLDNVQTRLDDLCPYERCNDEEHAEEWRKLAEQDVPVLIAEVRRLARRSLDLEQAAAEDKADAEAIDQALADRAAGELPVSYEEFAAEIGL